MNSIAMGCKMGAAVGGVFGTIMGCYASVVHRNVGDVFYAYEQKHKRKSMKNKLECILSFTK